MFPRTRSPPSSKPLRATSKYQQITRDYARQVVEKTRAELAIGIKKKAEPQPKPRPQSSWRKKPKSNS